MSGKLSQQNKCKSLFSQQQLLEKDDHLMIKLVLHSDQNGAFCVDVVLPKQVRGLSVDSGVPVAEPCCSLSVPPTGEHTPAQTLSGLAGHLGQGARDQRHGRRQPQVADGRRTRRPAVLHHHLQP